MNSYVRREYLRLRAAGWRACEALRAAKVADAWHDAENAGLVRVVCEPDIDIRVEDISDLSDMRKSDADRYRRELSSLVDREGIWIYETQFRTSEHCTWDTVDSIGGIIGEQWQDSGYDTDLKARALDALRVARDTASQAEADRIAERATYAGVST